MARHNIHVLWQMLFKRCDLWCFARRLATNDSTLLRGWFRQYASKVDSARLNRHTWSILRHHLIDGLSFDTVDDVVASSRDKMTVGVDVNIILLVLYYTCSRKSSKHLQLYTLPANSVFNPSYLSSLSQAFTLRSPAISHWPYWNV